jgi:hypothetical protein
MPSNPNTTLEALTPRDTTNSLERRTTSSTLSTSSKGYSVGGSETGNSSAGARKRDSDATLNDGIDYGLKTTPVKGHRSHRNRNSGGFLLANTAFESSSKVITPSNNGLRKRASPREKGKSVVSSNEKRTANKKSNIGLGIGGSPLAANVTVATPGDTDAESTKDDNSQKETSGARATSSGLDVDSVQMVHLALNLSESRRIAARRIASTPVPPLATTFGEGFSGGSLRQHLQQQRRVSRNVSPKPQRVTSTPNRVVAGQGNGPIHTYDHRPETAYQYHFSPSTLARAEKAKTQIELMAQYRRLLQYMPPLEPQSLERATTAGSATSTFSSTAPRKLGRPYNPLQYIRNRKVRARERKAIDGEAQGFENLDKVTSWIDQVSQLAASNNSGDGPSLPVFSKAAEIAASPATSPQATPGKSPSAPVKVKRPRIDWDTNPADMLADLFWLEQEDNKKYVEDRYGKPIFPPTSESTRPMSRKGEEPDALPSSEAKVLSSTDLRIDTKLPEFRSLKAEDKHDSTTSRVRHRIRDAARIHHGHNGSTHEARQFLRARSRSDSSSSDTDAGPRSLRRRRSGTAESHDRGRDILEKQMLEMLAKEARENEWSGSHPGLKLANTQKNTDKPGTSFDDDSQAGSVVAVKDHLLKRMPLQHNSSGRASLEVPGGNLRSSLEGWDSTAPNSPQLQAAQIANPFVPSINMDLTPPPRKGSPSRIAKVRSKINPFEHTRSHSRNRAETIAVENLVGRSVLTSEHSQSPEDPEKRARSMSPTKQIVTRRTDESGKSSRKGSIRRGKIDEPSGIRGLFKGNRGPVARVSDFLWKKESPVLGLSSGFSTDESDLEERVVPKESKGSRESSTGNVDDETTPLKPSYDLPDFTSPFERGRQGKEAVDPQSERQAREERRKSARAQLLETPPRIDIHQPSPASSPDLRPIDRFRSDSSVSDFDSRRPSYSTGVQSADARLNDILGLPGRRGIGMGGWPVTGLSNIETSNKRPSLDGKRQWSISDRGVSIHRGPMTKREIARVRAILLSSGIKAKEISRRSAEPKDLVSPYDTPAVQAIYKDVVQLAPNIVKPVPKVQQHIVAAEILSDNIQLSKQMWQASADVFCNTTVQDLVDRVENLQERIKDSLTPMARKAADEADEVSKDLVTSQTFKVKSIMDTMDKMLRRRRRRFRWLRRGGWVMVEWALVGVMWFVWFMVVFVRVFMGIGNGIYATTRWLLWL